MCLDEMNHELSENDIISTINIKNLSFMIKVVSIIFVQIDLYFSTNMIDIFFLFLHFSQTNAKFLSSFLIHISFASYCVCEVSPIFDQAKYNEANR